MQSSRVVRFVVSAIAGALWSVAASGCQEGSVSLCAGVVCSDHGVCVLDSRGAPGCLCESGWRGVDTRCLPDPCADYQCPATRGTCIVTDANTAYCSCNVGFDGDHCQRCAAGYVPEGFTCVKGQPCQSDPCVYGVCVVIDHTPTCTCHAGYSGHYCDLCEVGYHAENLRCVADGPCDDLPCGRHATCVVATATSPGYSCLCHVGYTGERCNDCDDGWHAHGVDCVADLPADPCDDNPCDEPRRTVCQAVQQSYLCLCDDGYVELDGACVESGLCAPNPCIEEHRTTCVEDGDDSFSCACDLGYYEDGPFCLPAAACLPNPCTQAHRTRCEEDGDDGHVCRCDAGHHLDGDSCVADTTCDAATTCSGHGQCSGVGLACACDEEWFGDHCQCNSAVHCSGHGRCAGVGTACLCDDAYAGGRCAVCAVGWQDNDGDGTCKAACATAGLDCGTTRQCDDRSGEAVCVDLPALPVRSCESVLNYTPSSGGVGPYYVRGEFNNWGLTHKMTAAGGVQRLTLTLSAGDYAYKIFDQGKNTWIVDPGNPLTKWVSGSQNSRLHVPDCSRPLWRLEGTPVAGASSLSFTAQFVAGKDGDPADAATISVAENGVAIDAYSYDKTTGLLTVSHSGLKASKYSYLLTARDAGNRVAERLFVPLWVENRSTPFDWREGVMYFVMTDRFNNGDAANDKPVNDGEVKAKVDWMGGDFAGVKAKIDDGYFSGMGVNVIWISSITMNTQKGWWGSDGYKYSGYHSYWPIATGWSRDTMLSGVQPVDPHFGSLQEFKDLVNAAHAKGIRVIVDFVANHVHTDHPWWDAAHKQQGWFNGAYNPYVCGWDKPIECWFAEYLPDIDYKNLNAMTAVMDHVVWLAQETNIDGFRLDAVKHMITDFSTAIRHATDTQVDTTPDVRFYMVGETFTGDDGQDTIKAYLGASMLDGQFDFPIYWWITKVFLREEDDMRLINSKLTWYENYYGSAAVMSPFLGNHDVPRALSHAAGQIGDLWGNGSKEQGWNNPPATPTDALPYQKLRLAWTFLFTFKGIPLIYYGDEFGLPGAGDPDNRRMMTFTGLNAPQQATLEHVRKLGAARVAHPALWKGTRRTLSIDNANGQFWAIGLTSGTDQAVAVFNRGYSTRQESLNVSAMGLKNGDKLTDILSGQSVTVQGTSFVVSVGAYSSAVYLK